MGAQTKRQLAQPGWLPPPLILSFCLPETTGSLSVAGKDGCPSGVYNEKWGKFGPGLRSVCFFLVFSPGTAMGIRFHCPNGHKLNVKSELAGKKAICPDCGARLVVPVARAALESTIRQASDARRANPDEEAGESRIIGTVAPSTVLHAPISSAVQSPAEPAPAGSIGQAPSATVWYIRPATGGQFGPIDDVEMRVWIENGKVAADSYVWRAGWPDWLKAGEAPDELPASLAVTTLIEPNSKAVARDVLGEVVETPSRLVPVAASLDELAVLPITGVRRPRRQTPLFVTVLLVLAIVVLSGVLIWVIERSAGNEPPAPQASYTPLVESLEWT